MRDPFTNPEQFQKIFARFDVKGWIFPSPDEEYQVSSKAQEAVLQIVHAGNMQLAGFDLLSTAELKQTLVFLKQVTASNMAKWATLKHVAEALYRSNLVCLLYFSRHIPFWAGGYCRRCSVGRSAVPSQAAGCRPRYEDVRGVRRRLAGRPRNPVHVASSGDSILVCAGSDSYMVCCKIARTTGC
jgi:hypothetical protein